MTPTPRLSARNLPSSVVSWVVNCAGLLSRDCTSTPARLAALRNLSSEALGSASVSSTKRLPRAPRDGRAWISFACSPIRRIMAFLPANSSRILALDILCSRLPGPMPLALACLSNSFLLIFLPCSARRSMRSPPSVKPLLPSRMPPPSARRFSITSSKSLVPLIALGALDNAARGPILAASEVQRANAGISFGSMPVKSRLDAICTEAARTPMPARRP